MKQLKTKKVQKVIANTFSESAIVAQASPSTLAFVFSETFNLPYIFELSYIYVKERYKLSPDDKIDEFLRENYQDELSKEYLVDGAILTCTNCTNKPFRNINKLSYNP